MMFTQLIHKPEKKKIHQLHTGLIQASQEIHSINRKKENKLFVKSIQFGHYIYILQAEIEWKIDNIIK